MSTVFSRQRTEGADPDARRADGGHDTMPGHYVTDGLNLFRLIDIEDGGRSVVLENCRTLWPLRLPARRCRELRVVHADAAAA